MPSSSVTIGGVTFANLTKHTKTPFNVGAAHALMDGTFKQDVYNSALKYRWTLGWEYMTASQLADLQAKFDDNTSHTFTDIDGASYTVVFEPFELAQEGRPEMDWSDRRYRVEITLRTV